MKMSFTYSIVMMRRCVKEKLPNLLLEVIHILLGKVLAQPRFHMKSKILTLIRVFLGPSPSVFSGKKIQIHHW